MGPINGNDVNIESDLDPPPEAVIWRLFWTEEGPTVDAVDQIRHIRQRAQSEASKLAHSIGAQRVVLNNGGVHGFIFRDKPDQRFFLHAEKIHHFESWKPRITTKRGALIQEQMNKIRYPDYSDAIDFSPFHRALRPPSHFGAVFYTSLGFYEKRVVVSAPFWNAEYLDWLFRQPENYDTTNLMRELGTGWKAPSPWNEWTEQDRQHYVAEFEAKMRRESRERTQGSEV